MKIFSSTPRNRSEKLSLYEKVTKGGSTKIVNFMTPGAGVLVLGHGHISHIVKMLNFISRQEDRGVGLKLCIILLTCINIKHINYHCFNGS